MTAPKSPKPATARSSSGVPTTRSSPAPSVPAGPNSTSGCKDPLLTAMIWLALMARPAMSGVSLPVVRMRITEAPSPRGAMAAISATYSTPDGPRSPAKTKPVCSGFMAVSNS